MLRHTLAVVLGLGLLATSASADPAVTFPVGKTVYSGRFGIHFTAPQHPGGKLVPGAPPAANTHILFINPCTGGCAVKAGTTDNQTGTSDIPQSNSNLSAFNGGTAEWGQVKSCVQNVFSRFDVTVVDTKPTTGPFVEVMTAGLGSQLGEPQGVLGIADFPCQAVGQCDSFMPNALVFAFANDPYYSGDPDDICATIAQEIAHTWALDHVVDASDPMTYNNYNGIRQYKDGQVCGSDCQGGQSPFGLTCSGSNDQTATHTCTGTGTATQDEVTTITALFGSSAPDNTPPTVTINSPSNNASVMPAFNITATVTDNNAVASAEAKLDGTSLGVSMSAPFSWTAPATLTQGSHTVEVVGTDLAGNTASAMVTVAYGSVCHSNSDCTTSGEVCNGGQCVAGPTSPGGLGTPCMGNSDCASNQCASDASGNKYCVVTCDPTASTCPGGFTCEAISANQGVCWPGANNGGGGGCNTSGNGGVVLLGLGLGAALITRRRRGH